MPNDSNDHGQRAELEIVEVGRDDTPPIEFLEQAEQLITIDEDYVEIRGQLLGLL